MINLVILLIPIVGGGGGGGGNNVACKRKEEPDQVPQPKKPRLVFTDLQRRTLQAIFKVFFIEIWTCPREFQHV